MHSFGELLTLVDRYERIFPREGSFTLMMIDEDRLYDALDKALRRGTPLTAEERADVQPQVPQGADI